MKNIVRCLCATLTLLFLTSMAPADLVLHVDEANSTATLTGSATADEQTIPFHGTGLRFGLSGSSIGHGGVFGTEDDAVNHAAIIQFAGGGIGFGAHEDTSATPNTTLTGSGVAVEITSEFFLSNLIARDGDVYTAFLNSTDTLSVTVDYAAVPEPAGLSLLGLGLVVCTVRRRRR